MPHRVMNLTLTNETQEVYNDFDANRKSHDRHLVLSTNFLVHILFSTFKLYVVYLTSCKIWNFRCQ